MLYPELDERGWRHRLIAPAGGAPEDGHVVVEIVRPDA